MDRNLPGVEGSEFVSDLRRQGVQTPVIYLSAKNKESDIEEGFALADVVYLEPLADYLLNGQAWGKR